MLMGYGSVGEGRELILGESWGWSCLYWVMDFLELRQRLGATPGADPDSVYFAHPGASEPPSGREPMWVIWDTGRGFDVGCYERGEFDLFDTFESEVDACAWVYGRLRPEPVALTTTDLRARRERLVSRIRGGLSAAGA